MTIMHHLSLAQNLRVFKIVKSIVFRQGDKPGIEYRNTSLEEFDNKATRYMKVASPDAHYPADTSRFILKPSQSNEDYLSKVRQVKSDISAGRFYQLNLLRYFDVDFHGNQSAIIERFFEHSGSHGAIFALHDEKVYSFSPERFVRFSHNSESILNLETWPIKGTRPRSSDAEQDQKYSNELRSSKKDQAELHMIVDLMRNDFRKISIAGTIDVVDRGCVHSFTSVHHLVAKIKAEMNSNMRFDDFFKALMPAGSITGAPKVEVMKAIRELENSDRNWFMGSAFYLDQMGNFDSSVLIRTLWEGVDGSLKYAAGSGLVIKSCPHDELQEIETKCRVLT